MLLPLMMPLFRRRAVICHTAAFRHSSADAAAVAIVDTQDYLFMMMFSPMLRFSASACFDFFAVSLFLCRHFHKRLLRL